MPYIKDKEGPGFSDVSNTQYPRYLCLDNYGLGHSPKNMGGDKGTDWVKNHHYWMKSCETEKNEC